MVKVKEHSHYRDDGSLDVDAWLNHLSNKPHLTQIALLRNACVLSELTHTKLEDETSESCLHQGLGMAEILADFDLDSTTLAAAVVYCNVHHAELNTHDVREHLGPKVAKLVAGVERMNDANILLRPAHGRHRYNLQADNLRKMLIAMVDDVRVVLIKLAESLYLLRHAQEKPEAYKHDLAQEAMEIYAPLANRLGIGQMKWELEDLAFRYLESDTYKKIAKGLKDKRLDREKFVDDTVNTLTEKIKELGIKTANVYGRSKHIFSIYTKMKRKNVLLEEVYDATALRVLVDTEDDCYHVLSVTHASWEQIPEEFDDYINHPKENGYRSLHTAVRDPSGRTFEVQIRTHQMHEEAELGVAAHWAYKEETSQTLSGHERKIAWLRELLAWQKEMAQDETSRQQLDAMEERVYVFTPTGDIVDLPKGATPLDFAYHIHSDVGHRCKGAKINDKIVPLVHALETGDQINILTQKNGKPSRDWLNPKEGYLTTSRARAKVHQWFKQEDFERYRHEGQEQFEREWRKAKLNHAINHEQLAHKLKFKHPADMYVALARGDLKFSHIVNLVKTDAKPAATTVDELAHKAEEKPTEAASGDFSIQGVENLLSRTAQCCKPIPGDAIIGYITQGQGVTIHRQDCSNISQLLETRRERLIEVSWGGAETKYPVDILITAQEGEDLVHAVTTVLATEKIHLRSLQSHVKKKENKAQVICTLEIPDMSHLDRIIQRLQQIPKVEDVRRR